MLSTAETEINSGKRFGFGKNWSRYLEGIDEAKIARATETLKAMLGVETLVGKRFIDIGSGSGINSLAARRLGAKVFSFDYDNDSVNCTKYLKDLYAPSDQNWQVEQGSVLDEAYLAKLGQFDVVYSWGVLHHTGQMWQALSNCLPMMAAEGKLYIALYNDEGWRSRYWEKVKSLYCKSKICRAFFLCFHFIYPTLPRYAVRLLSGRLGRHRRGMSIWYDYIDWLGGYPFEVATPKQVVDFYEKQGLTLTNQVFVKRSGCNEFVFEQK